MIFNDIFKTLIFRLWRIYHLLIDTVTLDIHLVEHCNLNCIGCLHYSPIAKKSFLDSRNLESSLKSLYRKKIYKRFKVIQLLGGEPLLHPDICELIKITKKYFPNNYFTIKLVTNGILLHAMNEEFWEICKNEGITISITVYPIALNYQGLKQLCVSKKVSFEFFGDRRTNGSWEQTRLKMQNKNNYKLKKNYFKCFYCNCLQLKDNKIFTCPQSAYIQHLNNRFGLNLNNEKGDFIEIAQLNFITYLIFRLKSKPFCRYCNVPNNKIKWEQSTKKIEEWVQNS
ncbi:MAG: radical SAM protein [Erysipelotrichales bacterium]|nr:radical SAM protein [Erysipelotrichales bacterium]